ncbi:MAG: four-carbon acid sugar kinase family protein [Anaerolineae bacterium]|nr:four-carbon acid sugar kinase family protein [Anaerolineae bacterium]
MTDLLLTFYGDDFTGSTDVMESLELGGVPAVLFLEPPTRDQLSGRFAHVRAVGVAGVSRTMSPAQMDAELIPAFKAINQLGAPFFHYKICSTFDSSPTVGSIGHAIDIGFDVFDPPVVPLMVGSPALRRYVVFGNLFARVGDVTYRLDRHPTMSKHPITPMTESDLRLHLGQQTTRSIGLIDVWHMEGPDAAVDERFQKLVADGMEIVLFDTLDQRHLAIVGRVIWAQRGEKPVFMVGSSGIENALTLHWQATGVVAKPEPLRSPGRVGQLVVVSGSAAPPTAEQIDYALARDFAGIRLDSACLVDPASADQERARAVQQALQVLSAGHSALLYSAHGPDDPAIAHTSQHMAALGMDPKAVGSRLGTQQGLILRDILERTDLKRACVAGGDTCGYASKQLGIYALETVVPIAPGAPLCRASSNTPRFDGLQISLKGGQNGQADYFVKIREGGAA